MAALSAVWAFATYEVNSRDNCPRKISMPVYRVNAMGIMTIRSDADIAKLKQQVAAK